MLVTFVWFRIVSTRSNCYAIIRGPGSGFNSIEPLVMWVIVDDTDGRLEEKTLTSGIVIRSRRISAAYHFNSTTTDRFWY